MKEKSLTSLSVIAGRTLREPRGGLSMRGSTCFTLDAFLNVPPLPSAGEGRGEGVEAVGRELQTRVIAERTLREPQGDQCDAVSLTQSPVTSLYHPQSWRRGTTTGKENR